MIFSSKKEMSERKIIDSIRMLGIDMIDAAGSGHPGIVLGAAPILYTLYAKHLNINPEDPNWINRDRFIMSSGHGSALLYAALIMSGYDISLDDAKKFRQLNSKLPGHPEYGLTPGVDCSTGPLGQGFATAVGMAIAEQYLNKYYNNLGVNLIDHYTYVFCGEGCLMEGISYEASNIAGNLKLNKLIVLYDCNNITLDGEASLSFNEHIPNRFLSCGWNVISVEDGNNLTLIDNAIAKAKTFKERPTLIIFKTIIGKDSKYENTNKVHGTPLEKEDILNMKNNLNIRDIPFAVSNDVSEQLQNMIKKRMNNKYNRYQEMINSLDEVLKKDIDRLQNNDLSINISNLDIELPTSEMEATRDSSSRVLNAISKKTPFFIGGSADLSSSTKTYLEDGGIFNKENRNGKNIFFGVREHASAAIINGITLSGIRSFASTFLTFSDYMKPSLRLASLMNIPSIFIFSHDSLFVGEDGPTHQPIEQLISLRSIPNMEVFRPADLNEVIGTYKYIMNKNEGPSSIILGRNKVKIQSTTSVNDVSKGAYILSKEENNLSAIIIATGEEVELALNVKENLILKGFDIRVISMPSIELFEKQSSKYKENLLPLGAKIFVIEASSSYSWYKYVYNDKYLININEFGKSANRKELLKEYNFTIEKIADRISKLLK